MSSRLIRSCSETESSAMSVPLGFDAALRSMLDAWKRSESLLRRASERVRSQRAFVMAIGELANRYFNDYRLSTAQIDLIRRMA